ncbi:MAG: hypothetical protein HYZ00_14605, partial [Candidatus Hydrogenedentes bacterium]|nr:hypothetical protein [Candidatus Hydrogenedentota bacterium]
MKRIAFVLVALAAALAGPGVQHLTSAQSDAELEQLARGRYLVEDVAQCIQCHSPRDTNGNLIQSSLLQ